MTLNESWHNVGEKIRYLRKSYGLTLKQLASGSGLSVNTISLVERSEVSPTIETLCKIARALGVSPGSLFLEICHAGVNLQRAKQIACGTGPAEEFMRMLTSSKPNTVIVSKDQEELAQSRVEKQHAILCLCGQVELELDGQNYQLYPGDRLDFNGGVFHRWDNLENETGVVILVIPPTMHKESQTGEDHDSTID